MASAAIIIGLFVIIGLTVVCRPPLTRKERLRKAVRKGYHARIILSYVSRKPA
jgi:hypothetical protein